MKLQKTLSADWIPILSLRWRLIKAWVKISELHKHASRRLQNYCPNCGLISLHHKKHIRRNNPPAIQAAHFLSLDLPRAIIINTDLFADKQKKFIQWQFCSCVKVAVLFCITLFYSTTELSALKRLQNSVSLRQFLFYSRVEISVMFTLKTPNYANRYQIVSAQFVRLGLQFSFKTPK